MHGVRWAGTVALVLAGLSGCGQPAAKEPAQTPSPTAGTPTAAPTSAVPVVSPQEKLFTSQAATANRAVRTRNLRLLGTVASGVLLSQFHGAFVIEKKLGAKKFEYEPYDEPYNFQVSETGPAGYAVQSGGANRRLTLVQRQRTPGLKPSWVWTYSADVSSEPDVPDLTGAKPVRNADLRRLTASPAQAAATFAKYFEEGLDSPSMDFFELAANPAVMIDAFDNKVRSLGSAISGAAASAEVQGSPVAFLTKSGEAVVFVTIHSQYIYNVPVGRTLQWNAGPEVAFAKGVAYSTSLTSDQLHQVVLTIPPRGQAKTRILSIDEQMISAGGR